MVMTAARMLAEEGDFTAAGSDHFPARGEETLASSQKLIIMAGCADDVDRPMGLHIRPGRRSWTSARLHRRCTTETENSRTSLSGDRAAHGARQRGINAVGNGGFINERGQYDPVWTRVSIL